MSRNNDIILISHRKGSQFVIFEDDAQTAYLYSYDANANRIEAHFHVYNDRDNLTSDDILLVWSQDRNKVAAFISESLFAIFDLQRRVGIKGGDLPISKSDLWFKGFEEVFR